MKSKVILIIFMLVAFAMNAQTFRHPGKVKITNTPAAVGTDEILAIDSDGQVVNTAVLVSTLGGGTGLEVLDEGNGNGWRLVGRAPLNYGNIGLNAVDFTNSTGASSVRGATGESNFAFGTDLQVEGFTNIAFGTDHVFNAGTYNSSNSVFGFENLVEPWSFASITSGYLNTLGTTGSTGGSNPVAWHSGNFGYSNNLYGGRGTYLLGSGLEGGSAFTTIVGAANIDLTSATANQNWSPSNTTLNPAFIVGVGTIDSSTPEVPIMTRANGFVVWRDGTAELPSATVSEIETRGSGAVITKEVLEGHIIKLEVEIQGAALSTLSTTPVEILAAPGAGLVYRFKGTSVAFMDFGTTAYDYATSIKVEYSTSGTDIASIDNGGMNDTDDRAFNIDKGSTSGVELSVNEAVRIRATADPTTGDGVFRAVFYYTIETTGF